MNDTVVLILCQHPGPEVLSEYHRISSSAGPNISTCLLVHSDARPPELNGVRLHACTNAKLASLPYPLFRKQVVPGSAHFPLLQFFQENPGYDWYWVIEHDVKFAGDWGTLFDAFASSKADFLTSHIRMFEDEPQWCWWKLSHPAETHELARRIRSFNPIYRLSKAALACLHNAHLAGWRGHFEVLMPTILFRAGFHLEDFGGTGRFVALENREKFYLEHPPNKDGYLHQGTMRFCPAFEKVGDDKNKLYHPVKKNYKLSLLRMGHLFRSKFLWGKGYRETR